MREFKNFCGDIEDLDDDKTYSHLPKTSKDLRKKIWEEIGYAYLYMNFWHNDVDFGLQKDRIEKMIYNYAQEDKNHYEDIKWLREWLFIFLDEIENMC